MTFQINNGVLSEALKSLNRVVPTRTTLPILSCVLFKSDGGKLNIRSTNLEVSMEFNLEAEISEAVNIAIPISKILNVTNSLKKEDLSFEINENFKVKITTRFGEYNIMGVSSEDFPNKAETVKENSLSFSSSDLEEIIDYTISSCSSDDLKPALQGVLLTFNEAKTTFVSTDGHRLSKVDIEKNGPTSKNLILPVKFFKLVQTFLNENDEVEFILSENHAEVFFKGINISTRLIQDSYPDYEKVIPQSNEKKVIIDNKEMTESLKRISSFSSKKTKQATLVINNNKINIKTEDTESSSSANEEIHCEYQGEETMIAFNCDYLREILEKTLTEKTTLLLKDNQSAALILPESSATPLKKLSLLMPIRLN